MEQEPRRSAVKNQQYIQGHHRPAAAPPRAARAAAGPRGRRWIRPVIRTGLALRLRGRGRFVRGARSFCLALDLAIGRPPRGAARIVRQTAVRGCARPTAVRRRADRRTEQGREPGGREERIRRFRGRYREFYMSRMFCSTCSMLRNTMLLKPTRDVREGKAWAGMAKPKAPLQSPAQHQRWHRQGQRLRASSAAMAETKDIALRTAAL